MGLFTCRSGKDIKIKDQDENQLHQLGNAPNLSQDKFSWNLEENMCKLKHPEIRFLNLDGARYLLIKPHTITYDNFEGLKPEDFYQSKNKYYHLFRHSMGYVNSTDFFRAYSEGNLKFDLSTYSNIFSTPADLDGFITELNKFENYQNPENALKKILGGNYMPEDFQELFKRIKEVDRACRNLYEVISKKGYFSKWSYFKGALVRSGVDYSAKLEEDKLDKHFSQDLLDSSAIVLNSLVNRPQIEKMKINGKPSLVIGPKEIENLHQELLKDYFNDNPIDNPSVTILGNGDIRLLEMHQIHGFFDFFKGLGENPMLAVHPLHGKNIFQQ